MKIHVDIDCFFVSAERIYDASLVGVPVAVGGRGDPYIFSHTPIEQHYNLDNRGAFLGAFFQNYDDSVDDRTKFIDRNGRIRGIVTTASYEARAYGIHTTMSIREALQRCQSLIIKAPNMKRYKQLSHALHDFLHERIPLLQQASIDEFYGDLDGWIADEDVEAFIHALRHDIITTLHLPVSIGASPTKSIAKLATSVAKPFGCHVVKERDVLRFIDPIAVAKFPGIGRSMQHRLSRYHIHTLGELVRAKKLLHSMSPYAATLYKKVCGHDIEPLKPYRPRQSIGISRTFDPVIDRLELRRRIIILSRHLAFAVMRLDVLPTTFTVGIRYEMSQHTHATATQYRLFHELWFKTLVLKLFDEAEQHRRLRVIRLSISCSQFTCHSKRTLSLLDFKHDSNIRKLSKSTQKMQQKYGLDILRWGSELS